jgi:uncharacterized protein (DUF58 family)
VSDRPQRAREVVRAVSAAVPTWNAELRARRTVDGIGAGDHPTGRLGSGSDPAEARGYEPGDDVRRIDWSATARIGQVQVRDAISERDLCITLVLDCSPSMRFGTDTVDKGDLALGVATAVALTATRRGDAIAALLSTVGRDVWVPASAGNDHVNVLLRRIEDAFTRDGEVDFAASIRRAASLSTRRGLAVVVSDFLDDDLTPHIRRLASRHRTVCVVVYDRRERALVPVGPVELVHPETGRRFVLDTDSAAVRDRFESLARRRAEQRCGALRAAGAEVVELGTSPRWLRDVADIVGGLR